MKSSTPLKDHVIIYDDECPLCNAYTGAFVKMKFLDQNGRLPYVHIDQLPADQLDRKRAVNEIPLLNIKTGQVTYGVDSLLKVLGNKWQVFHYVPKVPLLNTSVRKLYSFISYNRKVIVPGKSNYTSCIPAFSMKYRLLYLLFCSLLVATSLYFFNRNLSDLVAGQSFGVEFLFATGQIFFQSIFLINKDKVTIYNYLGNLMTVSLMGALALIPVILISYLIVIDPLILLIYFLSVAGLMFIEHFRRVKLLGLSTLLCATWVAYRLLLLLLIL
ncbi:MAG: DCC1-like thiol-disulfide oxidoreductase family protein [Cyclobacteriaceae bacterium]